MGARWRRRLLPDLSLLISFLALVYCLFFFDGVVRLFHDADTGWHIRTGETILASRALPRTDPYSFTHYGRPWFAWAWGADVLMGAAHRAAGLGGVALLYAAAIAACVWLWFRLHWQVGGNFWIACAMAAPMLSTMNLHWLARPHVLSWLLLLLAVLYAETEHVRFRPADAAWILAGSALWANVHASFLLAPAVALLYAAAYALRPIAWELDRTAEWARARWFLRAAAFALLGSFLNPYGWKLHAHVFEFLGASEMLARIREYQTFNFHAEGAFQILVCVMLAGFGAVAALAEKRLAHFLLSALLLALALRSARGLPMVVLAVLPLANGGITAALRDLAGPGACGLRSAVREGIRRFLAYSDRLRAIDAGLNGAPLIPAVLLLALAWIRIPAVAARTGFSPERFPAAAARALESLPPNARILNPDKYGGYLIYRFAGTRKVFFDGRFDFYGLDHMMRYFRLVQLRPGWRESLDEFGFTHALLPSDSPLAGALEELGWKPLYGDRVATLLARP